MAILPTITNQRNNTTLDNLVNSIELGRRLVIVQHGERVDRCFPDWFPNTFPSKLPALCTTRFDNYSRVNLNMPRRCPLHIPAEYPPACVYDYKSDSPLTSMGEGTAERLGSLIFGSHLKITKVYCSPALRCMQTCNRVLQGFCEASGIENASMAKRQRPVCVEPALFDFTGETYLLFPTFLPADFVIERHMYINKSYEEALNVDSLEAREDIDQFYSRIQIAINKILKDTEGEPQSSILIVTHGAVMDAICQLLLRQSKRTEAMFPKVANYPPYLATMVMEENVALRSGLKWRLAPPPIKSFTHLVNATFEWKKLCERR